MVLPGVSVWRMLPATGPGGELDARQQEMQAQRNTHLSDGRTAATWRSHGNFTREFLLFEVGPNEGDKLTLSYDALSQGFIYNVSGPGPGIAHKSRHISALKPPKRRKSGSSVPDALTLLLFPCRLLPLCSIHNPDLWLWHTPHSWHKDRSLQRRPGPDTGGCPPELDPGDT